MKNKSFLSRHWEKIKDLIALGLLVFGIYNFSNGNVVQAITNCIFGLYLFNANRIDRLEATVNILVQREIDRNEAEIDAMESNTLDV